MLAYVFWHRCKEGIPRERYEENLGRFHDVLNASNIPGFAGSVVFRTSAEPWFKPPNSEGYEDWYLLDGSEVMDRINIAAVIEARKDPHDAIARMATDFHGGLYQLKFGTVSSTSSITQMNAIWISKPNGMSYDFFYDSLDEYFTERTSLWRRQMTLGPTPEFCLLLDNDISISPDFAPITIHRQVIWMGRKD